MDSENGSHARLNGWRARLGKARREWRAFLTTRTGIGLVVAFVVVAIVADALPSPQPEPSPGEPTGRPGPSVTPGATEPPAEAWGDLSIPDWEPVAELQPVDADASGVAVHSAFRLRSRTSVPAAVLAAGLTSEPPVTFRVRPGETAAEVTVSPAEDLAEGVLYRFRLADSTGALAGSWAFRTERPLHVVTTLPGHRATSVPVDTGIEIEFDQDGVTDISREFSIEPAVAGRFEVHGRTVVFVPSAPLTPASSYRVTIAAGVGMTGSDQVLEAPISFAFETAAKDNRTPAWDVVLGRSIIEASPDEPPIVGLDIVQPDGASPRTGIPFEVYRLPSITAAREAAVTLSLDDGWGQWASDGLVPTAALPRVAAFTAALLAASELSVVRFPAALPAGWYLVVVPRDGRDRQALLQVTTLAAFALTSETRTVAWVNDTATGASVTGAVVTDPTGASIGITAANGLLDVPTPVSLLGEENASTSSGGATLVTVTAPDGRRLLLALGLQQRTSAYPYEFNSASQRSSPDHRWWLLMATDRTTYRSTDTIHTWGLIRSRANATVPNRLELTLRTQETSPSNGPWLARVPVTTTARGTWAADLPVHDLPPGGYYVELRAGDIVATSTWITVAEIRKPAFRIDVATDARAYLAGEPVTISGQAVFFDGTVVAGIELRVDAFDEVKTITADTLGRVRVVVPARTAGGPYLDHRSIQISPSAPEEGEIAGSTSAFVFPSAVWIKASGTITGGRLVLSGSLNRVDLDRVERQVALGDWPEDPSGAAIVGRTVTIRVVENIPIARQVGTTYDFIEKRAIPLIEYTYQQKDVGTYTTTSGTGGAITLNVPLPNAQHEYNVTLTALDADRRKATTELYVVPSNDAIDERRFVRPYLEGEEGCSYYSQSHAVGDTFALTMHDSDGSVSTGGRYLFVVARHGVRDVIVGDASTLKRTYAETDLPSLGVIAVRFKDGAYVVTNEVLVTTKLESRTLGVELSADRPRYAPGGRATIAVRTTDQNGQPIATDVVVSAVDEKLFEISAALDVDALAALVAPVGDGFLQSYASHPVPLPDRGFDCGGGGGEREDFRDSALFELISTGADGRGSVAFDLPDDLTNWHVSATALASDVRAGSGTLLVPVGLPFFADAIIASDYLVGERPVLRVRSFGDDLDAGDRVRFTISAPSLLLPATTVEAAAFGTATLQLPELPVGVHDLRISASVVGDAGRSDTLIRRIVVRWSRLEVATSSTTTAAAAGSVGGPGLTTYVVTDAGRGSLVPFLQSLAYGEGARFDRRLAADLARDLLVESFGFADGGLPPVDLEVARYQRGGLALLPYSSADLGLTAMSAIVAPERLNTGDARVALREWMADASTNRERQIIALAGLAGIGDDVQADLLAIDVDAVTVREALWIALGLVALGDENGARGIERALLEAHGQAFGPWVRLDVGGSLTETLDAASLLALVATGVGDPLAPSVARYLREVHTTESLYVLPEIGFIRWSLDRLPRAAASFAWTVDGERHTETLDPGASWSVALSEAQRAGFLIEPLTGAVSVIATWSRIASASDLPSGDLVTISRTVTPAADAPTTGLVKVRLRVQFAATAPKGCWEVSDRTPSGLAPLVNIQGWDAGTRTDFVWPHEISGQRVSWCVNPASELGLTVTLGYSARVVSSGTFVWEPAIVQSEGAPDVGAATPTTDYTIR